MRRVTAYVAAFVSLGGWACEVEPSVPPDAGAPVLTPDASAPAGGDAAVSPGSDAATAHDAAVSLDAAPRPPDAATALDAAPSTPDARPPEHMDASGDADQRPVDAGAKTCASGSPLKPGVTTVALTVGGLQRSFRLFVPKTYTGATPVPLVIDFHGLHLDAVSYGSAFSEWDDRVDQEGYVLAMPQGVDNAWNIGPCCTESRALDDVAFARAIVDHVSKAGCVDERRVYAVGYSNGGGMSFKLGCDAADVFAAVAPAAFDLLEEMNCSPARPLSVFISRGTEDVIVPYAGGASTPPTFYTLPEIHFLGARRTFERWAQLDGCTGMAEDMGNGCLTYTTCSAGVKVMLCTAQGGGHDPNTPDKMWPLLKGFAKP